MRKLTEDLTLSQRIADAITHFAGTMAFVYIHVVLFTLWIVSHGFGHDAFPFNFLTMTVSLEAIFLSSFVMISQNRSGERDRIVLEHDLTATERAVGQNMQILRRLARIESLLDKGPGHGD